MIVERLDEFHVHALGEKLGFFKSGTYLGDVEIVHVVGKDHAVRVAHGHAGDLVFFAAHFYLAVHDALAFRLDGHSRGRQLRLAHIHADHDDLARAGDDLDVLDPAERLDRELLLVDDMRVVEILGDAAYAVAAHFALRAV